MDIGQLVFPFIMAVLTSSLMIVAIYFLRKIPYFANLFSVWFMVVLYLVGVLRVFLPLEFPGLHIILRDDMILNSVVEALWVRVDNSASRPGVLFFVILGVWLAGTLIFAVVSVVIQKSETTYYLANTDFTTEEEKRIFDRISKEVLGKADNLCLKKTDAVKRIMVIGYFKRYILLPVKDYSPVELEMILRHECTHIRNKDLLIKLLVHIYCCIFWWNPMSYLLKLDLGFTLEMRCDLSATKDFSDDERENYFNALIANCRVKPKKQKKQKGEKSKKDDKDNKDKNEKRHDRNYFFINAELFDGSKKKDFVRRMKAIAKDPPKKAGQIIANVLVSLVLLAIFIASYLFIWQPFYGPEVDEDNYNTTSLNFDIIADDTNSYLVRQPDGSYLFYCLDFPPEHIPKEEVEQGLYAGYPILEN